MARHVGRRHVHLQDNTHLKSFACALVAVSLQHPESSGPMSYQFTMQGEDKKTEGSNIGDMTFIRF